MAMYSTCLLSFKNLNILNYDKGEQQIVNI